MAVREYQCQECGHILERLELPGNEYDRPWRCPECCMLGSFSMLISPSSFQLKGGGWTEKGPGRSE